MTEQSVGLIWNRDLLMRVVFGWSWKRNLGAKIRESPVITDDKTTRFFPSLPLCGGSAMLQEHAIGLIRAPGYIWDKTRIEACRSPGAFISRLDNRLLRIYVTLTQQTLLPQMTQAGIWCYKSSPQRRVMLVRLRCGGSMKYLKKDRRPSSARACCL